MIPEHNAAGELPPGRFRTTLAETEQAYVAAPPFAGSATRAQIWQDFRDVLEVLSRGRVRVAAAWVGGTFTSSKLDPSDVDATILVDASRITSPATWDFINKTANAPKTGGWQVDLLVIPWRPEGDEPKMDPVYLWNRGKWDDWWQRSVPKSERLTPMRAHAMPVRGYLEVIVDGYQ